MAQTHALRSLRKWLLVFLVLLALVVGGIFAILLRGLTLGPFSVAGIKVGHFYAHFDGKLNLAISDVVVPAGAPNSPSSARPSLDPGRLEDFLNVIAIAVKAFTAIDIDQVKYGALVVDLCYRAQGPGHLRAHSPTMDMVLDLHMAGEQLHITIEQFHAASFGVQASGEVTVDIAKQALTATLDGTAANTLPLMLELKADRHQVSFSGRGKEPIPSIAPLVDLFPISAKVRPWIADYLQGSAFALTQFSGSLPYDDPKRVLQTLVAEAHVSDTAYTFAVGLAPAHAQETALVFEKGVLHIYPQHSSFYGQDGGDTTVDIDFNDSRVAIKVFIRTLAQASGGVLTLLQYYGIPFPFEQLSGLTDTQLTLTITLNPFEIETVGRFVANDSVIALGQQQFDVSQFNVALNNSVVTLNAVDLALRELFAASVSGALDLAAQQGDLDIAVNQFRWAPKGAKRGLEAIVDDAGTPALRLQYHLRPDADAIETTASRWRYGDLRIDVDGFTTPFDSNTLAGSLDAVGINVAPWMHLQVSGDYSAHAPYAELDLLLQSLDHSAIRLAHAPAAVKVNVGDKSVRVVTPHRVPLTMANRRVDVQPTQVQLRDGMLEIEHSGLHLPRTARAGLRGKLDLTDQRGQLLVQQLLVDSATLGPVVASDGELELDLDWGRDKLQLTMPSLGLDFQRRNNGGWTLRSQDLGKLSAQSPLMQRFEVEAGHVEISTATGALPYDFTGALIYPHTVLVAGDQPVSDYFFKGSYKDKDTDLVVNDKVHISVSDSVRISSRDIGYSVPALVDIIKRHSTHAPLAKPHPDEQVGAQEPPNREQSAAPKGLHLSLNASDTFVYLGEKQRVLATALTGSYHSGAAKAELHHRAGSALMEYAEQGFHLTGHGFDDDFINAIIPHDYFDGGTLEFRAQGQPQQFKGAVRITDATIRGFQTLYNVLALADTVPGLLTFHLPDYNSEGLPMEETYAGFDYLKGVISINTAQLTSEEMTLRGSGPIDLHNKSTDLIVNFIGGAHKNIAKIPLLGWILTGGNKKPTLTINVRGDMKNPEVSTTAFKEVVTYPFQVITRAILLPVHMAKEVKAEEASKHQP